ncbi:MAG: choice-of-anchor B family protein [Bacteroidetes bacterium]|nr:choice-of-anchor B family protein [Bacteroidota bacterium]
MKKIQLLLVFLLVSIASYAQFNLNLLGHLPYPNNTCAGIWHYVDSVGNEYAIVGVNDRVAIVDVTTPATLSEVFSVPALPGQVSLWREIKTYGKYAYAVSEGGGGVIIIDLSGLPGSINSKHYYGDGVILNQITSAHTIAVADGYGYIFGTGNGLANGGAVIVDLADPWNPVYVGQYDQEYIHDGYIRNDTLWAGEIYAGQFSVIDVSNKANPVLLATQATPGQFCHNTWLTDNSQFLFTTDEIHGQPLGSFDITDLSNIKLVDTYLTDSMPNEEVHNVRVLNDFLINPSYGSQLTICDGARPNNIVEIASYPTGSYLCWDASPYLPSGRIIVADVDGGVYVFEPNYQRACYLEGTVTDSVTGLPINNASITINPSSKFILSNLIGEFKTGFATAGTYDVEFKKAGYITKTITGVSLINGQLTNLNILLAPFELVGNVSSASTSNPIEELLFLLLMVPTLLLQLRMSMEISP